MSYRGDIALGSTIDLKFSTRRFSTGAPFTLAGSPSLAAYPDNSTTEITSGITLTVDFDGHTGLNHVRVVATSGNGYAAGSNYDLVITAGTVDGVSVVGEAIGSFSIDARTGLDAAGVRSAVGLGSANLDTQLSGISDVTTLLEPFVDGSEFLPVDAHAPHFDVTGTTLTVKKPDGTTTAYTKTVTTDPSADPITGAS